MLGTATRRRQPTPRSRRRAGRQGLRFETLERRQLLSITPGTTYGSTPATWTDADGDTVTVSVTGTLAPGAGFTVELEGVATDHADATLINLTGLTAENGLQIVVTPNVLATQPGTSFATLYSAGYTNVAFLGNESPAAPMTALGGIQLSAAVVNSISLAGVAIGDIALDPGQAPYVDRINTQNNQQATDSTKYSPVTGLIDLGGITAASIDSLVINGAISDITNNPYDTSVTNDFRSVITVSGRIGSVIGLRSSLSAAIRADSIGSVRVANIAGEITTKNSAESLSINLPSAFKGFINSAGHLNLGFPLSDGALITGQITAGGGISGSDKNSTTDTLYIPDGFAGSLGNTSTTTGIADVAIDGIGMLGLTSASSVGSISADSFSGDFVVEAATSIGNVDAGSGALEGHLQAGTNIGSIKAVRDVLGTMIAGGNIGSITTVNGGLQSLSLQAGGNVGTMSLYTGMLGTSIVAGGDIGTIKIPVGGIALSYLRAVNVGQITVVDGSIATSSFVASNDIGAISTFGSIAGFGISDTSIVAGRTINPIVSQAHTGYGIDRLKLEAGVSIEGVTGISYGQFGELDGAGIIESNFLANWIGDVYGRSAGGTGIEASTVVTRVGSNLASSPTNAGSIGEVTGDGWLNGLLDVIVVADRSIGHITGTAHVDGSGINGGSYDANYGTIGQITAIGGARGGFGITATRFQATDPEVGRIAGISTTANSNGRDAMNETTVYATTIGPIAATVTGGLDGNGIVGGEIRAFGTNAYPDYGSIDSISVDVRSINGIGILDGMITASGDIGPMTVKAFNNTAVSGGTFTSRGNFGDITLTATKGGSGVENATFTASGRIFFSPDTNADEDPRGNFGAITVTAGGTQATANAIVGSRFTAIGNIGIVTAMSKGGGGIVDSVFTADSDGNYDPNPDVSMPWLARGNIDGIVVTASGRNLAASGGIVNSEFTAANIGTFDNAGKNVGIVSVDVQTVEGGDGIAQSSFVVRTAVYDGKGNFDNTGSIGTVTVKNAADQAGVGNGISGSTFLAGAAGGFGNIAVTTASGSGIVASSFDASVIGRDIDQNVYSSTIGAITVNAGRTVATTLPAGITGSTFTSAAGIGPITVNSIGSGITGSVFIADFDWTLTTSVVGNIGTIAVNVPGRSASGVTGSSFFGSSIGNIDVLLVNNAQEGLNAVALSTFTAWSGSIGNVTVKHSMNGTPYATGLGYAILTSTFSAATSIGAITIQGNTLGAVFIVSGQPVVFVAQVQSQSTSIGAVTLLGGSSQDLKFQSVGSIGSLTFANAPSGGTVTLTLAGSSVGSILVDAPGSSSAANLTLSGNATTFGNVTVDGNLSMTATAAMTFGNVAVGSNASLALPSVQTLGSLNVGGALSLPNGLPKLQTAGTFTARSFAAVSKNVQIGSRAAAGTSIGLITIQSRNTGKGKYQFAFANYKGSPNNAVMAGKAVKTVKNRPVVVQGVSFVKLPPPKTKK